MIRRVYTNQHGIITLDSDLFGNRKRLSTGKKSDKRLLQWYEKHFDEEFRKLYEEKFKPKNESFSDYTLREYGKIVLNMTSENRRAYVHRRTLGVFNNICDFSIAPNRKFGELKISEIKSLHVMQWQKECGWSYQTIVTNRAYLNMVLQVAVNDDLIRKNPVASVRLPQKRSVREKTFYSEEDIKKILSCATGQLRNYLQLDFFTGMRGSELLALRWDGDIDFDNNIIRVDSGIVKGHEDETKSKRVRIIPMFPQAKEALLRQRKYSGLREFVFINRSGSRYYGAQSMNRLFTKMLRDNHLPMGTVHDIRRSFNTILKQYGYPPDWILDIMGHMDERVNRNHYTGHLNVDMTKLQSIAL